MGAARAVVLHLDHEPVAVAGDPDVDTGRVGVLPGVREGLRDDEVRGALDRDRRPRTGFRGHSHGERRAGCKGVHRGLEPPVGQDGRVDAPSKVAQLLERFVRAEPGLREQLHRGFRVGRELLLGHPDAHPQGDQARLGAVVQIPLDPAQLRTLRVDGAGPGRGQHVDPLLQLRFSR